MKIGIALGVSLAMLAASSSIAQTALPPQVQADLLLQKIDASMEAGNAQEALQGLEEYRKLGVKMPPALLFLEGRLSAIIKDYQRSKRALTEYLADPAARNDKDYGTALTLYAAVETAATAQITAQCSAMSQQAAAVIAGGQAGAKFRECPFAPEVVIVSAGSFVMGSPEREDGRDGDEGPQHGVTVQAFAVGRYEVTAEEFAACEVAGNCAGAEPQGTGREPVRNVSWNDAKAYVAWLSEITGKTYRLLSEAEWEYAARAGTTTPWSTGTGITAAQANFAPSGRPRVVGSYPANAFGLHDMHGNVWEWVEDCWNSGYAGAPPDGSAWLSGDCALRVYRGGSWFNEPRYLRSAFRNRNPSGYRYFSYGFRVARTLD